jgi:hypothetical protein
MFIDTEHILKIAIRTLDKPISLPHFKRFIYKSPFVRQVAFIGKAIFDLPEFVELLDFCREQNLSVIFGEVGPTSIENIEALVKFGCVMAINIHEGDPNIQKIFDFQAKYCLPVPEVNVIVKLDTPRTPQDTLSDTSYSFYNLADDTREIACLNMLEEPLVDYDGSLLGCWQNPDKKHPINLFDLGIDKAMNTAHYKAILKMLKSGKINTSCPCARCPIFASLIWTGKTIDVCERVSKN